MDNKTYDAMTDWLRANNVNPAKTPIWPNLAIDDNAGTFTIDQEADDETGARMLLQLGGCIQYLPIPTTFPLLHPMPDALRYWWENLAAAEKTRMDTRDLLAAMQGSTVLNVEKGTRLVFVGQRQLSNETSFRTVEALRELFPNNEVAVVSGVRAVIVEENFTGSRSDQINVV